MTKQITLQVVVYAEEGWKKRKGKKWRSYIVRVMNSSSKLASDLIGISIILNVVKIIHCEKIATGKINSAWRKSKKIRDKYKKAFGADYRLREIFLLSETLREFMAWIIKQDFSPLGNPDYTSYVHIGFFNLYNKGGGGMAKKNAPILIIHSTKNSKACTATLIHELFHTFGASHSIKGIMTADYPIDTGHLDKKNKNIIKGYLSKRYST